MPRHRSDPRNRGKRRSVKSVNTPKPDADARAAPGPYPPPDRFDQRPILCAIIERCGELAREASRLPRGSAEQRAIDRRIQKLRAYTFSHPYKKPAVEQDAVTRRFAEALLRGGVYTWQEVKRLTDDFAARMFTRPVGRPVDYRYRVTEAYEIKLATKRSWPDIATQLHIPHLDLQRQLRQLKHVLKDEGINISFG